MCLHYGGQQEDLGCQRDYPYPLVHWCPADCHCRNPKSLECSLLQAIQTFNLPPSAASAYLQALAQLTADVAKKSLDNGSLYQRSILNWGSTVLRCAEKNLTAFMGACGNDDGRPSEDVDFQEHGVANTLFVIGEVVPFPLFRLRCLQKSCTRI